MNAGLLPERASAYQESLLPMRTCPLKPLSQQNLGMLLCFGFLWGCATPARLTEPNNSGMASPLHANPAPEAVPTDTASAADDLAILRTVPFASLSPQQGAEERNIGERVRWAGAVQRIAASDRGMCLTILYARSGEAGEPRWTNTPTYQNFEACAAKGYDPDLVREHTNVTIIGRISGSADIGSGGSGNTGPVVQIDRLFRWSDCLAGDASPECKIGFLSPRADVAD